MALVIFCVFLTLVTRFFNFFQRLHLVRIPLCEFIQCRLYLFSHFVELRPSSDFVEQCATVVGQKSKQPVHPLADVLHLVVIERTLSSPQTAAPLECRHRAVQTAAAWRISTKRSPRRKVFLRRLVEVRAELRKGCQLPILCQFQAQRARQFLPRTALCASPPTRDTDKPAFMAGRTPLKNRSASRNICPSVIEMTLVGI